MCSCCHFKQYLSDISLFIQSLANFVEKVHYVTKKIILKILIHIKSQNSENSVKLLTFIGWTSAIGTQYDQDGSF